MFFFHLHICAHNHKVANMLLLLSASREINFKLRQAVSLDFNMQENLVKSFILQKLLLLMGAHFG